MMRVQRDERERQIDMRAGEISYVLLGFGVLVAVLVRSLQGEAPFDLLALVVISGLAGQLYVMRHGAYSRVFLAGAAIAMVLPFIIGAIVASLR